MKAKCIYIYQRMYICANVDIKLTRYVFIPCDFQHRRVEKGVKVFTKHRLKISERRQH